GAEERMTGGGLKRGPPVIKAGDDTGGALLEKAMIFPGKPSHASRDQDTEQADFELFRNREPECCYHPKQKHQQPSAFGTGPIEAAEGGCQKTESRQGDNSDQDRAGSVRHARASTPNAPNQNAEPRERPR